MIKSKSKKILLAVLAFSFIIFLTACEDTTFSVNEPGDIIDNDNGVEVYNIELSRDNLNWIEVLGEVRNRTEEKLSYVSISVDVYNENDVRVASGYANEANLGIDESFEWVATTGYGGEYEYYEVEMEYSH